MSGGCARPKSATKRQKRCRKEDLEVAVSPRPGSLEDDLVYTYGFSSFEEGSRLLWAIDPRGNSVGADPNQYKVVFEYDASGNLTRAAWPALTSGPDAGQVIQVLRHFLPDGRLDWVEDPDGVRTQYGYATSGEDEGFLTQVCVDPQGVAICDTYGHNALGFETLHIDPSSAAFTKEYNVLGEPVRITSPAPYNYEVTFHYDSHGNVVELEELNVDGQNVVSVTDPQIEKLLTYDALGHPVSVDIERENGVFSHVDIAYNGRGQVQLVRDDLGEELVSEYDSRGNLPPEMFRRTVPASMTQGYVRTGVAGGSRRLRRWALARRRSCPRRPDP